MKIYLLACLAALPRLALAQGAPTFKDEEADAPVTTKAAATVPAEVDAKIAATSKNQDPRKGPVELSFKYGAAPDVRVTLTFEKVKEPSSGDGSFGTSGTVSKPVRFFTATDQTKTVTKDNSAWTIAAKAEYNPPATKDPLGDVTDDETTTKWVFGVIQNSENLKYAFDYGGAKTYGNSVKAPAVDISPKSPTAAPFYHDNARTPLVFGQNGITVSDTPGFEAAPDDAGKPIHAVSLDGKWTLWFVLRNKSTNSTVYLWNISYDIGRKWLDMTAAGGTVKITQGVGKGASSPVLTGVTSYKQLNAAWAHP